MDLVGGLGVGADLGHRALLEVQDLVAEPLEALEREQHLVGLDHLLGHVRLEAVLLDKVDGLLQILQAALVHRLHQIWGADFKGEVQNRFNFIAEERVNIFEQNSENLMTIS